MYFHSVTLDEESCKGCTVCIKGCPTEAIRVQKGRAFIIPERCIDCGECIRTCPHEAKKAISDPLSLLEDFDYTVAIPAPTLYGQFKDNVSCNRILTGLKRLGFDEVYEVAAAAEIITDLTKKYLNQKKPGIPLISSSCPVVVRLIQSRFPSLTDQIIPLISPMELSARIVKEKLKKKKGKCGVFFISPCAAKVTAVKSPRGFHESFVDGVFSIKEIYKPLKQAAADLKEEEDLSQASFVGISWARTDGEGSAVYAENHISVDGINHVIDVLESMENGHIQDVGFVEMMCCPGGCVGGPMTVENPYIAKTRIYNRERTNQKISASDLSSELPAGIKTLWDKELETRSIFQLDQDYRKAIQMMEELETLLQGLPGLDCGSCGAPSCRALAEDIVRGKASETDCVFKLREKIRELTREMIDLESRMPPGLDR